MSTLDLTDLLEYCSSDITTRQAELISCEKDLLDILEKRDLIDRISLENRKPLTTIKVKEAISNYNPTNENLQNDYTLERIKAEEERKFNLAQAKINSDNLNNKNDLNIGSNTTKTSNNLENEKPHGVNNNKESDKLFEMKKAWIYKEISLEIGKKWRDFGRGINMREGEMDDLEIQCKGVEERVYKMLAKLEQNEFYNFDMVYYYIIQSLEESCFRRKLSDKIKRAMLK